MKRKSNYLSWVLILVTIVAILYTSYNTLIKRDVDIIITEEMEETEE